MIRHIALFRWTDDATPEQQAEVARRLGELPAHIPGIRSYAFGSDVAVNVGNFDFAVVADFDDVDGYVAYRDHEAHQAVIAECIAPIRAERAAVQFEL
jgi:hypothetical protein